MKKNTDMKRSVFTIILLVSVLQTGFAQINITGKVRDAETMKPLAGASIYGPDKSFSTSTDQKGHFELNLDHKPDSIIVDFVGYETRALKIGDQHKNLTIALKRVPREIEEVVVTGTKVGVARKNVPMTVSVVDKQEIEASNETNLLPVISGRVPGVFVTERGVTGFGVASGSAGQINVRGLGGSPTTQVLILINGHPQFMGLMGHPLPDSYVSSSTERVEVLRGPASVLYGSNAMGGAINIITQQQGKEGFKANGKATYGSFNTQKYMADAGYKKNGWQLFGSVNHNHTDGHREHSEFDITNGYLKTGYRINSHYRINADFSMSKFYSEDPGMVNGSVGENINIKRGRAYLSLQNEYERINGALKMYYNFGEHNISDGWHSVDEHSGLMFYQGINLFKGNTVTVGYDYMNFGGKGSPISTVLREEDGRIIRDSTGAPQFRLSPKNNQWTDITTHAMYTLIKQQLFDKLTLNGGIRYQMNSIYGNEWIPYGGFSYSLSSNTIIKSSVAKGYRPPSIRELYFFPPANEDLQPENMMNYELSWIQYWFGKRLKSEITGFLSTGDNRIVMVPPMPPQYENSGEFQNQGIELSLDYSPVKPIGIQANYTYIQMDKPMIATPVHHANLFMNYRWNKLNVNLHLQSIFDLYTQNSTGKIAIVEENYNLLECRIGYHLSNNASLFVNAENILDESYQINYGYPMPGITFSTGVNLYF